MVEEKDRSANLEVVWRAQRIPTEKLGLLWPKNNQAEDLLAARVARRAPRSVPPQFLLFKTFQIVYEDRRPLATGREMRSALIRDDLDPPVEYLLRCIVSQVLPTKHAGICGRLMAHLAEAFRMRRAHRHQ